MLSAGHIIFSIVLAVAFLIAPPTRAEKIRTAVPGLNLNYLSVFTAEERNFFRDEGLENENHRHRGPAGIAALVSGDVDYSGAGGVGYARPSRERRSKRSCTKPKNPPGIWSFIPASLRYLTSKGKNRGFTYRRQRGSVHDAVCRARRAVRQGCDKNIPGHEPGRQDFSDKERRGICRGAGPRGNRHGGTRRIAKLGLLGDIFPLPFQGYVTTDRKIAENSAQVKRWIRAMVKSLMFLRERPEEAAEVALKRLRFRNITKPMLTDAIKSYVRAFPQGIPGMPSPEGVKNILEYEVRLPMKMEETVPAEKFLDLRWVEEVKKELQQKPVGK